MRVRAPRPVNALDLLRRDHRNVCALLKRFQHADVDDEQRALRSRIVGELRAHTQMEEMLLYPFLREATGREDLFHEASIEHEIATDLLRQLQHQALGTARIKAMMKVLAEQIEHHVREEETEIFPAIEQTGVDLLALGAALQECRGGEPATAGHGHS